MSITLHTGDCRAVLATLPDASVHCVVTSPPYWGLRDYGVAGQLGLESDFRDYVATMVAVFREVRRVLRKDGTLWLNLGDSYAAGGNGGHNNRSANFHGHSSRVGDMTGSRKVEPRGLKPKDLVGIPWRVAFALQEDGWYLRQDIIWSKPNPMPESVTDRCTKAHEYLFLLAKSERYFYDAEAIAEDSAQPERAGKIETSFSTSNPTCSLRQDIGRSVLRSATRNKRSVWEVSTQPFSEAHFATFPPALIEPCIKAGTSERGCCAKCGAPWVRQTEYGEIVSTGGSDKGMRAQNMAAYDPSGSHTIQSAYNTGNFVQRAKNTTGWSPSCRCNAEAVACTVLDPFAGAGTTGLVADRLQRNAILIELNPDYSTMSERRIRDDAPLFIEMVR